VRVFTWAASSSSRSIADVALCTDAAVVAALLAVRALDDGDASDLAGARSRLQQECQQIAQACGPSCQEALSPLHLRVLGMLKSAAFRASSGDVGPDLRAALWSRLEALPIDQLDPYLRPALLPALPPTLQQPGAPDAGPAAGGRPCGCGHEEPHSLPWCLPLARSSLSPDGVYLLDDGETISAWIGRDVPLDPWSLWQLLCGAGDVRQHQGPWAEACVALFRALCCSRRYGFLLRLGPMVRQGDSGEEAFLSRLIEDDGPGQLLSFRKWSQCLFLPSAPC